MPVFNNVLAGSSGQTSGGGSTPAGDYTIQRSLRFDSSSSAYLSKTFSTNGDRQKWTFSFWMKRCKLGVKQTLFGSQGTNDNDYTEIYIDTDDKLFIRFGYLSVVEIKPARRYRDTSAWQHIVLAMDTQASGTDRFKVYNNGELIEVFTTDQRSSFSGTYGIGRAGLHKIGAAPNGSADYSDFYLAELHYVNGSQNSASDFGQYDTTTGVWGPKAFAGQYGTNGFHLKLADNSSNSALGTDSSGNGNNWSVHNLNAVNGPTPTSPSANYNDNTLGYYLNGNPPIFLTKRPDGTSVASSITHGGNTGTTWSVGDVLQWAIDQDNGDLWLGRNNTWYSGNPSTGASPSMENWGSVNLFLGKAYNSSDLKLEVTSTSAYTPPTGYTYWSGATSGSWVGSGGSTSNTANDIFSTLIPSSGKVYIEAKIKGGLSVYSCIGLMNVGDTVIETDSFIDTPTNYDDGTNVGGNYCCWNPLDPNGGNFSNGNLEMQGANAWRQAKGTIAVSRGKWYYEATYKGSQWGSSASNEAAAIGFYKVNADTSANGISSSSTYSNALAFSQNGYFCNFAAQSSVRSQIANGDVIGVSVDFDAGTYAFYLNGSSFASGNLGHTGKLVPWTASYYSNSTGYFVCNFGQRQFAFTPPSNHLSICTQNLPDPLVANPKSVMDIDLYNGNSGTQVRSEFSFSPELTWIKWRANGSYSHNIFDAVRGATKVIYSDSGTNEATDANSLTSFDANGFTLGNSGPVNNSGTSYVAWAWDAENLASNSAYYQGQSWSSTGAADSYGFDGSTSYNSSATRMYGTSTYHKIVDADTAFTGVTSVIVGTSENAGNIKLDGTVYTTSYASGVGLTVTNPPSSFSDIEVLGTSGGLQIAYVKVNNKLLVDTGVIPAASLNSTVYDQSQTWSSGVGTTRNGDPATHAFDGNASTNAAANATSLGWTVSLSNVTSMQIRCRSGNGSSSYTLTVSGTGINNLVIPGNETGELKTLTVTSSSVSNLTITTSNSGGLAPGISQVYVNGKLLIDSGVTVANVPTITSTCRSNQSAGFSICSYQGSGGSATVAHNCNASPGLIIIKNLSATAHWYVYHSGLASGKALNLNQTGGEFTPGQAGITSVSSSTFTLGSNRGETNASGNNYIAYCWAPVEGVSAMGVYTGSSNLPFVYTGFKVGFILLKRKDSNGDWILHDTTRKPSNGTGDNNTLVANVSNGEDGYYTATQVSVDYLSNGFKLRHTGGPLNDTSAQYIWAAWASNPFKHQSRAN